MGLVVWFTSIVAADFYALGFGYFTTVAALAIIATSMYACSLARKSGGGAQWANIGKLIDFAILIAGGLWA